MSMRIREPHYSPWVHNGTDVMLSFRMIKSILCLQCPSPVIVLERDQSVASVEDTTEFNKQATLRADDKETVTMY